MKFVQINAQLTVINATATSKFATGMISILNRPIQTQVLDGKMRPNSKYRKTIVEHNQSILSAITKSKSIMVVRTS